MAVSGLDMCDSSFLRAHAFSYVFFRAAQRAIKIDRESRRAAFGSAGHAGSAGSRPRDNTQQMRTDESRIPLSTRVPSEAARKCDRDGDSIFRYSDGIVRRITTRPRACAE